MEKSSSPSASVADDKSTLFQNPEFQVPPWEPSRICLPVSLCPGDDTTVVDLKQWFVNVDNPNLLSHHMVSDVRTPFVGLCAHHLCLHNLSPVSYQHGFSQYSLIGQALLAPINSKGKW